MLPFNRAPFPENAIPYMKQAFQDRISGDGPFTWKCADWLKNKSKAAQVLLTTSGSHALDMAAYLCGLKSGDEVIMASYTFSSTANAFVGVGATIVFVDIRPDTMNIDEKIIEAAITSRTKVIVPMHYAGVSCEMEAISALAEKYKLKVVEDAAQALMSTYRGRQLGGLADFGCFSFHETKNYSMGEGGALLIKDPSMIEAAEIMREKGTNRSKFFRGQVDKYSWIDWGSSYLPSDLNAAYLWSQLEIAEEINQNRLAAWQLYFDNLRPLAERGLIELPAIPDNCEHNAHMFYTKTQDLDERSRLISSLTERGLGGAYHYVPLHSAAAGRKYGRFHGEDRFTTKESERLLRLPLFYQLKPEEINQVIECVTAFYEKC